VVKQTYIEKGIKMSHKKENCGDKYLSSAIKNFEIKINEYKDDLFGITLFYEQCKLLYPSSLLEGVNFEKHYSNIIRRSEDFFKKAGTIFEEVKITRNFDKLKEIEFPPLEKDMMAYGGVLSSNMPRLKLLTQTYGELFPGRDKRIPLTEKEHRLIMDKVMDKF